MKRLLFFFLILLTSFSQAQIFEATIKDLNRVPIKKVDIENLVTGQKKRTNADGKAYFKLDTILFLEITSLAHDSKIVRVDPQENVDTLRLTFLLEADFQLLEPVEITSGRVKSSLNLKNLNVIDYVPYPNYTLALVKFEGKRYLSLNNQFNKPLIQKKLYFWQRELELKEDCLGNVHVLTNDSTFQITIKDSSFVLINGRNKNNFLNEFGSCFADFETHQFYSVYELHDRVYNVFSAKKSNKAVLPIFSIFDEETYISSKSLLNEIFLLYNLETFGSEIQISRGIWDGDLRRLAITRRLEQMVVFYEALMSKAFCVRAFSYRNQVVVVDQVSGLLHKAKNDGTFIGEFAFDYKTLESPWFMQDRTTEQIYALEKEDKKVNIYKLDFTKNEVVFVTVIDDYDYPENIKFDNGWVYFLGFENQFKKLLRIKL